MRRLALALAGLPLIALAGCATHQAPAPTSQPQMIPPRVDLRQHEMIGVVEFTCSSEGKLGPLVTRRFVEWARRDQGMIRVVELGSKKAALRSVDKERWDPEAFKTLG